MNSMTGYGKGQHELGGKVYTLEMRSVNHRYLEVKSRLPKGMLLVEENMEKVLKKSFNRGSFTIQLDVTASTVGTKDLKIDFELAEAYYNAGKRIKDHLGLPYNLSLQDLIRYPEVVKSESLELETDLWAAVEPALLQGIEQLTLMRYKEGEQLKKDFQERLTLMVSLLNQVDQYSEQIVFEYRDKLRDRIATLLEGVPVNEDRIAYEVAAFADKSNITEEILRLQIHIGHFKEYLDGDEPAGRKLDFLIQEMNREVNTIGSKSNSTDIGAIIVQLKGEMEKIREQVQNIE